ncbi:MAG TPA: hypothetical protein VE270_12525, partial [Thermoleophilaceae bacterium]|nr:hypothetical protein [Thermoleophilaceae bacterium]
MRTIAALLLAAIAVLALAGCEPTITAKTRGASDVTHSSARLRGEARCTDVRVSGEWWYEYRAVGASSWTAAGPRRRFVCTGPSPGTAAPSEQVTGLVPDSAYEFRVAADPDPPGGQTGWVDSVGGTNGTNYSRFTTQTPPRVTPKSAFALRDSIGVVTHIVYYDTAYGDWNRIIWRLAELGIGHLREGVYANPDWRDWNERYYRAVEQAAALGIKFNFGFMGDQTGTIDQRLAVIAGRLSGTAASIEGENEFDLFGGRENWEVELAYRQAGLYTAAKRHPSAEIRGLPVIGPSFARTETQASFAAFNPSGWMDLGNIHPYTGGSSPDPFHLALELQRAAGVSGSKPVFATEAGFHTALSMPRGDNQPPVSEAAQAVYVLRTLLEHYAMGVRRTFVYELIDEFPDPGKTDAESNFGLLRHDFSPKPAFVALRNLLAILSTQERASMRPLRVGVAGPASGVRQLVLQRRDGTYLVFLWRTANVWDRDQRRPLTVEPVRLTVSLPDAS